MRHFNALKSYSGLPGSAKAVVLAALLLLTGSLASATDKYSVATGNWSSTGTWSLTSGGTPGAEAPVAGDNVYIQNGFNVTLDANTAALALLNIEAGGTFTAASAYTVSATAIVVNGTYANGSTGAITVTSMSVNGTYQHNINGGTIPVATWSLNSNCEITGITNTRPTIPVATFGNFTWNCTSQSVSIDLSGQLTDINGNFNVTATGTNNMKLCYSASGAISVDGNYTQTGGVVVLGPLASGNAVTMTVGGNFSLTSGTFYLAGANGAGTLNVTGDFLSAGIFNFMFTTYLSTPELNVTGNCSITGGTFNMSTNASGATLNVDGNCSIAVAAVNMSSGIGTGTINVGKDITLTSGSVIMSSDGGSGVLDVDGNYLQNGCSLTMSSGIGTGTINVAKDYTLTSGTVNMTTAGGQGVIDVDGNYLQNGGNLNMSSGAGIGTLNIAGNFSPTGGTITENASGSGAIVFNGTGMQTYTSGGTITNTINFTVNSGSYLQMAAPTTAVNGSGSFTLSPGATLGITSQYGITKSATSNPGNIAVTGTRTFSAGAKYIYNGTANQVTGDGLTQNTPAALTINSSAIVTLSAATTVSGLLTMAGGTLNMAGYKLTAGSLAGSANISGTTGALMLTVGGDNTSTTYSGVISNGAATSVGLTKNGSGTLTLSGANAYTGVTTISDGVLQSGSATSISDGSKVVLNGGTLSTGDGAGFSETVGILNLQTNSTIALGTGDHNLTFSESSGESWGEGAILTVTGWTGTIGSSGTGGKIFFGSSESGLSVTQLPQIVFNVDGTEYSATILSTGEVVPSTPPVINTIVNDGTVCAGIMIVIPFTYSPTVNFSSATFTAQLSDASGSFDNPVSLGKITSDDSGYQFIVGIIPAGSSSSTSYRTRVNSDIPAVTGEPSDELSISAPLTLVTVSPADEQNICVSGMGMMLTATENNGDGTSIKSRQWGKRSVSGGTITNITGATGSTYIPNGASLGEGIWYIVCKSTPDCGTAKISNEVTFIVFPGGSWMGGTADWNNATNWCGGVPSYSSNVIISSSVSNQPVISGAPEGTCNNLTLNEGASLTINAGQALTVNGNLSNSGTVTIKSSSLTSNGSLIVNGSGSGGVTYERQLSTGVNGDYHYFSSPVGSNTNANAGKVSQVWGWDEETASWPVKSMTALTSGRGYNLAQVTGSDGLISFTGSVVTSTVPVTATSPYADILLPDGPYEGREMAAGRDLAANWGGGGWNMLGNPFTSAISRSEFVSENSDKFDPNYAAVYVYNGSVGERGTYIMNPVNIQAGQGFMVMAMRNGVTFSFTPGTSGMQVHAPGAAMVKSAISDEETWPGLYLKVQYGSNERQTQIMYDNTMKAGLDPGYDIGQLSTGPAVEIYTALVVDNGVNFAQQALPIVDCDKRVVAIGVDSKDGGEVTFSAVTVPLAGYQYYLEDRPAGKFTELGVETYTVTLPANTYGTGRFYLHTKDGVPTGTDPDISDPLDMRIWAYDDAIMIQGAVSSKATCTVYNVQGNMIHNQRLTNETMNTIPMKSSVKGVYIVVVNDEGKIHRQKVMMF